MGRKKLRQPKIPATAPPISTAPKPRTWLKHALAAAALCVVTLVAYSNSFHAGFVIDNRYLILEDPRIRAATPENIDSIFQHSYWWPTSEVDLYRPVTTLSYLFNYAALDNADRPEGYHWINFLLHFVNVLLVYALALRFLKKFWPAIFFAALWAVHPALTESVTNIIGRADLLAALAVLSGFLMYLKSAESTGLKRYAWLFGLMAVTAIGAFSKESAVAILGVVLLYEFTFWNENESKPEHIRASILGCAAIAIPILVMLFQRTVVIGASLPATFPFLDNPLRGASFFRARTTAIAVIGKYLGLLVWPATLSTDYSYSQIPIATGTPHEWLAWIAVIALAVAVLSQFSRNRNIFFFGAFAFVTFLPTANLLFLTGTIMAERFLYLPSIGFAACTVVIVYAIAERVRLPKLAPVALCLFISAFAARTYARNVDWQTQFSIAQADVHASPNSFKTHFDMAAAISTDDRTGANLYAALDEIQKSVAILNAVPNSDSFAGIYAEGGRDFANKGNLLLRIGPDGQPIMTPEADQAYRKALELLQRGEEIDQAATSAYRERVRLAGKDATLPFGIPRVYEQLAGVYLRLGEFQKAYEAAAHARLLEPTKSDNYVMMGQALAVQKRWEDAALVSMEGLLASGDQNFAASLGELYKTGIDPDRCAFQQTPQGSVLNLRCAPVHRELCQASAELMKLYRQSGHIDFAQGIRSKAIEQFGCLAKEVE